MGAFFDTLVMFKKYLDNPAPYSYEQWRLFPEEQKTAALYVNFYNEIILAYRKNCSKYATEEDCVSRLCQYLNRNVPHIIREPNRYNEAYIYTVATNSINTLTHSTRVSKHTKFFYDNVFTEGYSTPDDRALNIFDILPDENNDVWLRLFASKIPELEKQLTPQEYRVAEYIMYERRLPKRLARKYEPILASIRVKFNELLK